MKSVPVFGLVFFFFCARVCFFCALFFFSVPVVRARTKIERERRREKVIMSSSNSCDLHVVWDLDSCPAPGNKAVECWNRLSEDLRARFRARLASAKAAGHPACLSPDDINALDSAGVTIYTGPRSGAFPVTVNFLFVGVGWLLSVPGV